MANDNRATRRAATPEEKKLIRIPIALFDAATSPAKTSDFGPVRELDIGEGDATFLIGEIWNSSLVVLMMMMSEQAHGLPVRVAPGEVAFSQPRLNKALIQLSRLRVATRIDGSFSRVEPAIVKIRKASGRAPALWRVNDGLMIPMIERFRYAKIPARSMLSKSCLKCVAVAIQIRNNQSMIIRLQGFPIRMLDAKTSVEELVAAGILEEPEADVARVDSYLWKSYGSMRRKGRRGKSSRKQ